MMDSDVLVSVAHADGVAGVVRCGGRMWLAGYLGGGATGLESYWSSVEGLTGKRSAEGGMLPPGAVGAEVVDRSGRRHRAICANGAWVIVLGEPTIGDVRPVRFLDAQGNTVMRPVPDGWALEGRLPDRGESCPACAHRVWERIRAPDGSFGMRWAGEDASPDEPPDIVPEIGEDWEATPWRRCTACGHAESERTSVQLLVSDDNALSDQPNAPRD